jgi:hypothetical protein
MEALALPGGPSCRRPSRFRSFHLEELLGRAVLEMEHVLHLFSGVSNPRLLVNSFNRHRMAMCPSLSLLAFTATPLCTTMFRDNPPRIQSCMEKICRPGIRSVRLTNK